jgi:hypothetical protein
MVWTGRAWWAGALITLCWVPAAQAARAARGPAAIKPAPAPKQPRKLLVFTLVVWAILA